MLEGIDWANDRDWGRALFLRTPDLNQARKLLALNYPHFRTPKIVQVFTSDDE